MPQKLPVLGPVRPADANREGVKLIELDRIDIHGAHIEGIDRKRIRRAGLHVSLRSA
jgi:hypothetical protein